MDTVNDTAVEQRQLAQIRQYIDAQWQILLAAQTVAVDVLALWSSCKFVVLAQDERVYRQIGPLLANLSGDVHARAEQVRELMLSALLQPASRRSHANALKHVAGFVKKSWTPEEKQAWLQALADYEQGCAKFSTPAILLQQLLLRHGNVYVREQHYPRWFLGDLPPRDDSAQG